MRPTVEDLQAIWLFTYSRSSLLEAREFLAELDKATPESVQYRALVHAAIMAYLRPFTDCYLPPDRKRVVPLRNFPPPHLTEAHEHAFNLRDTVIGHKDATPAEGYTATLNIVVVTIDPDPAKFRIDSMTTSEITPPMKNALRELCDYFVKQCEGNLSRLKNRYLPELMEKQPGEYELVTSAAPAEWLIPYRPKDGTDFRVAP